MEFERPRLHQRFLYWLGVAVFWTFYKLVWRMEARGMENVPKTGGVLIASNHASNADPPFVTVNVSRQLYFFAKEELFKIPVFGWLIRQVNAFPVKRYEHDVGAFKRAQFLLEHGQAVLLFPEGRRSKDGRLGKAKPGVGMLAYKAGVPVVPVYIHNNNRLGALPKVTVTFGRPMVPPATANEKDAYQPFSDSVLGAVAELQAKMYNKNPT